MRNGQAYQQKTEKFFFYEEKKFGRIDSYSIFDFRMARQRQLTEAERQELPSSLFLWSGTNPFRRAAIWISRWIVFEWIIILTIIGKNTNNNNKLFISFTKPVFVLVNRHGRNDRSLRRYRKHLF